ncbi:MAG: hypothetical protein OIN85_06785 [Candidatus Methanoperedens sp.]|nr:hypothetical protein [Candidatus Methanoperedens sp.]
MDTIILLVVVNNLNLEAFCYAGVLDIWEKYYKNCNIKFLAPAGAGDCSEACRPCEMGRLPQSIDIYRYVFLIGLRWLIKQPEEHGFDGYGRIFFSRVNPCSLRSTSQKGKAFQ